VTAYRTVILDVDSTVSSLEGIDWLAQRRPPEIASLVAALTDDAMNARVPLDAVYGRRLAIIAPTRSEIQALGAEYIKTAVAGVRDAVQAWQAAGVRVVLVSGGLRDALLPLAAWLGIGAPDVYAVDVEYTDAGVADLVREPALLARRGGKPQVVDSLDLPRPILAVGDGATDAELTRCVDQFLAFTGVVRRDAVVALAAGEVSSFAALTPIVLGS
jgi:phosphoserine phosphatase